MLTVCPITIVIILVLNMNLLLFQYSKDSHQLERAEKGHNIL